MVWVQCGQLVHTLKSATRGAEKTAEVQAEGGRYYNFWRLRQFKAWWLREFHCGASGRVQVSCSLLERTLPVSVPGQTGPKGASN